MAEYGFVRGRAKLKNNDWAWHKVLNGYAYPVNSGTMIERKGDRFFTRPATKEECLRAKELARAA